ncbi:MerR family transcriptional regulator [Nocardioides sp. Y6]|uniref:MerR family transcriptional regulator n=1 Tax=Nocardioides malaquae TaxID=2773426 RepID=A0ABR9RT19_9ACTN|nr:MerR family transcriptional regulator [Nocardioides malaquae]MBE7324729.1 MerR family transcriptional regulator [Nocardioides malaquae]
MSTVYTIKRAAEIVGVPVATLRAWERRYQVAEPQRSESGYRLYDDRAVRALTCMQSLVNEGWAPRQAAEETRRRLGEERTPEPLSDDDVRRSQGEADRLRSQDVTEAIEELLLAAEHLDVGAVTRLLDARYAVDSFESVTDDWLMPALHQLGLAWASGRVSVAGEHMVAHAVVRRLSAAYEAAGTAGIGPRVIVGLAPRSRHEIGLLAFAVAARRAGLATTYVGADLPVDDWVSAVHTRRADAVVLAASMERDLEAVEGVVGSLGTARPELVVAVGGQLQDRAPASCVRLGHRVGEGARLLAERLA